VPRQYSAPAKAMDGCARLVGGVMKRWRRYGWVLFGGEGVLRSEGSGWNVRDVERARMGYCCRREVVVWLMRVDSDWVGGDVCGAC
jgi:hypothetical protein